jgi:hypothetical protein
MEEVLKHDKEFELITIKADPKYSSLVVGFETVRQFIADNDLILYGGMAIDYALRLQGDHIYPDDNIPDYDFYSPINVEHSYQLADILYHKGFPDSRAINAMHMETMKNDIGDNHFISDITYRPKDIFDTLPYLKYDNLRIIHPNFQRIDMHSSLAFPYDGPPQEVIFARWAKDIKRFNKLDQYYPITLTGSEEKVGKGIMLLRPVTVPNPRFVLTGFAAYAVIYTEFAKQQKQITGDISQIIPATIKITDADITFDTLDQTCEFVHTHPEKVIDELKLTNITKYEPYANLIPSRTEGWLKDDKKIVVLETSNRLVSVNSVTIDGLKVRITNIQFVMKQFLSMYYYLLSKTPKIANTYLAYYKSLLDMIKTGKDVSILHPSISTYGGDNISLSREVALNRMNNDLYGKEVFKIPRNYYPGKSIPNNRPHPEFDPEEVIFFRESGRPLD